MKENDFGEALMKSEIPRCVNGLEERSLGVTASLREKGCIRSEALRRRV